MIGCFVLFSFWCICSDSGICGEGLSLVFIPIFLESSPFLSLPVSGAWWIGGLVKGDLRSHVGTDLCIRCCMPALRTTCSACTLHALRPKNWSACKFLAFLSHTCDTWFQMYWAVPESSICSIARSMYALRWDAMHRTPTTTLQVAFLRFSALAARSKWGPNALILLKQVLYVYEFFPDGNYTCPMLLEGDWALFTVISQNSDMESSTHWYQTYDLVWT